MTAGLVKASKEVIVNEPIWQDKPFSKTHPVQRTYSQNPDFFTFALLCQTVYADLEAENFRLQREMTLTAFQHSAQFPIQGLRQLRTYLNSQLVDLKWIIITLMNATSPLL
ncbi:uncharacterized protein [Bombus fervidus]|uniref:uncharacterized protein n=1 Tax=Bombus fervidus TaxID=203811 RepID=UPI003D18C61B